MHDTTMEGTEHYIAASSVCHFLRIPKGMTSRFHNPSSSTHSNNGHPEIRLNIYRYLLLPTSIIYICPDQPVRRPGQPVNSEDEWVDESSEDSDWDDELNEIIRDGGKESVNDWENLPSTVEDDNDFKKHPAILRTNRQIYDEASSLLYTEATLTLDPGDIFCLAKRPHALMFGTPNEMPWRHNPLNGLGKKDENGVVTYDTPQTGGLMEPHVFARFQKIFFDGFFDIEHTQNVELWIDDDTYVIKAEDAAKYQRVLRRSNIIKDLVQILSNSPLIKRLEISLEVEVMAGSNLLMEEPLEESGDEADEMDMKVDKIEEIANEKATELFLDSKICDPLLKLSNVYTFDFRFGFEHREKGEEYKPLPRHVNLLRDMKATIEANFKEHVSA